MKADLKTAIASDYSDGLSLRDISRKRLIGATTARRIVNKAGLTRSVSEAKRKYKIDPTAFDVITDEAAYWCGFLVTDGNVCATSDNGFNLSIKLQVLDESHLDKFRVFMKCNYPIRSIAPRVHYGKNGLRISSGPGVELCFRAPKHLIVALQALGITPRKTFTAQADNRLASNPHFWRGCIDGDGSIMIGRTPQGIPIPIVQLTGAAPLLMKQFQHYIKLQCERYSGHIYTTSGPAMVVVVSGTNAIQLLARLYTTGDQSLERKGLRARWILAAHNVNPSWMTSKPHSSPRFILPSQPSPFKPRIN